MSVNESRNPVSRTPRVLIRWTIAYILLHLLVAIVFFWIIAGIVRNQMLKDTRRRMNDMATQLVTYISLNPDGFNDPGIPGFLAELGNGTSARYTLVDNEGVVIFDSQTGDRDIGDHGDRPEILEAQSSGTGHSIRVSGTLEQEMLYVARAMPDGTGNVVRVASPTDSIHSAIRALRNYILALTLILGAITALAMTWFSSRALAPLSEFASAAKRIGEGDFTSFAPMRRQDEWGDLRATIRKMQKELHSREKRLTSNSLRLEAVLSSMVEGVIATDPTGTVTHANLAACRMLSISRESLVAQKLLAVVRIPELQRAVEISQLKQTFSKTEFQTLTEPRRTLSGRINVLDKSPESTGVAIVLNDVTDLRQLETVRSDFVANVSHELKTPLAAIKAYAETLRLGAIDDADNNRRFVAQIEAQADLLNLQIQDLIQLGRVESGREAFDVTTVSVNDVCHACFDNLVDFARQQKVKLQLELSDDRPVIRADEEGIVTIVRNLVSNAIQYTPEDGVVVIETGIDGESATVKVVDDGIGISQEDQARIFERFFRVDKARSREMGSTGLGLSIVKHLCQAFDGSVEVQSTIGKGSTFTVRIPLLRTTDPNQSLLS